MVFNAIRTRLKTEPITAEMLTETRLGAILHRYSKFHPIRDHNLTANELLNEMKPRIGEQSAKKARLDCAVQPNADTIAQTTSQEVAVMPSSSARDDVETP